MKGLAGWNAAKPNAVELPFKVARVILQDFTGVPCVVDLAAMRAAMKRAGGDPQKINPLVPVDLVIDHSVQVDEFGTPMRAEQQRRDRVRAQPRALRVPEVGPEGVQQLRRRAAGHGHRPPGEPRIPREGRAGRKDGVRVPRLARRHRQPHDDDQRPGRRRLGRRRHRGRGVHARPADLHGHAARSSASSCTGELPEGATATDLVLTITQILRKHGVVEKFVEFFGDGPGDHVASPTARRSPTWPRNTARRWASSRSTSRR